MPDPDPLCPTCRFNELRRYLMRGVPTESRGCEKQIASFPKAEHCQFYEREPGVD